MTTSLQASLKNLHLKNPLVLCLTNYVTMDFTANALLAVRAAPLMTESLAEVEELLDLSQALYINTGTINLEFMKLALFAAGKAKRQKIPVILDPVGAGVSFIRTSSGKELLHLADIIRGNASEIRSLGGIGGSNRGVESAHLVDEAIDIANHLAKNHNKIIAISGPQDYVSNGINHQRLSWGSPVMTAVTGMGCALTAIIAAFAASNSNYYQAVTDAVTYFGLCGQLTAQITEKPGTFKSLFLDTLFEPDWKAINGLHHA